LTTKKITLLSPYHGGSHQVWAEGYQRNSAFSVDLLTLPARFWKWRMHGGAVTLARKFLTYLEALEQPPDLILATDMLDLTTFLALTRRQMTSIPVVLYMHENQLTYPLPVDGTKGPMRRQMGERDRHYAFINFSSMLAADRIFFNSQFHLDSLFSALAPFLRHFPEFKELQTIDHLIEKSQVVPVGIDLQRLDSLIPSHRASQDPPLILWNQRLEYDKNPLPFVRALNQIAAEGIPFRVAFCGERFGKPDSELAGSLEQLGDWMVFNGYANEEVYRQLLGEAAIVVSTAFHEFFGIGIVEAIYAQTFPLLPARLSYPEIIPTPYHAECLYKSQQDMLKRLRWVLQEPETIGKIAVDLAGRMAVYDWQIVAPHYDATLAGLMW
jgi:glycosyltransferase involved in cell wall biosynthesis